MSVYGTEVDYTNWQATQPDDSQGAEDCVHSTGTHPSPDWSHVWNDRPCSYSISSLGYLCEIRIDEDTLEDDCSQDCAGEWGGLAYEDECGVCDSDPSNDCVDVIEISFDNQNNIDAGGHHNLVLHDDGTVSAWGDDEYGQSTVPNGLSDVVAISGGFDHSLALHSDGTVSAWGMDHEGQSTVPDGLFDVVAISAGKYHNIALHSDGTVSAWGSDDYGQSTVPEGLSDVVEVSAGWSHNLVLHSDGAVSAWGDDLYGQSSVPDDLPPVLVYD